MSKTITLTDTELHAVIEGLDLLIQHRQEYASDLWASGLTDEQLTLLGNRISLTQDGFASVWTLDDVLDIVDEDEGTQHLDAKTTEIIAKRLLASVENRLLDIFAERGNDYISQRWHDDADDLIREATQAQPAAQPSASSEAI
jgi:hypothetical protein